LATSIGDANAEKVDQFSKCDARHSSFSHVYNSPRRK
jgi:hypothetical protein